MEFFGDLLGGGKMTFEESKRGVEGFLETLNGELIPISLKDMQDTETMKNILRTIRENGGKIMEESLLDPRIIIGEGANSKLFGDIPFTKDEFLHFLNTEAKPNAMPSTEIFNDIILRTKDNEIINLFEKIK